MKKVLKLLLSTMMVVALIVPLSLTNTHAAVTEIKTAQDLCDQIIAFGGDANISNNKVYLNSNLTLNTSQYFKFVGTTEPITLDIGEHTINSTNQNEVFCIINCENNITIQTTYLYTAEDEYYDGEQENGKVNITGSGGCVVYASNTISSPGSINLKNLELTSTNGYGMNIYGSRLNMTNVEITAPLCAINIKPTASYKSGMSLNDCTLKATGTTDSAEVIKTTTTSDSLTPSISIKNSKIDGGSVGISGSGAITLTSTNVNSNKNGIKIIDATGIKPSSVTINGSTNIMYGSQNAIYFDGGSLTINDGQFQGGDGYEAIRIIKSSSATINFGYFMSKVSAISTYNDLVINNGVFNSSNGDAIYVKGGTTTINNASIYAANRGVCLYGSGNAVLYKAVVEATSLSSSTSIVHANSEQVTSDSPTSYPDRTKYLVRPKIKSITLSYTTATYSGSAKKPTVKVVDVNGKTLELGADYAVKYSNNTNVGTATVKVMPGDGAYEGYAGITKTLTFTIKPKAVASAPTLANASSGISIKWSKAAGATKYRVYRSANGGTYTKIKETSELSYTDTAASTNGRKYQYKIMAYKPVTVSGKTTNYTAASYSPVKTTYKVAKPKISSLTPGYKKMTVKWSANTSASGYRIYYSTSSTFSSSKYVSISSKSTTSKTISSLSSGKKYYVRMKTYKTVSGTNYWSVYSDKKYTTTY